MLPTFKDYDVLARQMRTKEKYNPDLVPSMMQKFFWTVNGAGVGILFDSNSGNQIDPGQVVREGSKDGFKDSVRCIRDYYQEYKK